VWEGVWVGVGEVMEMVIQAMVGKIKDLGQVEEALQEVAMGQKVDIVAEEVEEEEAVLVGLKRFNQTTKYLSRVYQQMLQKRILHNFLGQ
jgi:hypothetical protein